MVNCWSLVTGSSGGCVTSSGYYDWGATISPPSITPVLPIPTYVTATIWDSVHCALRSNAEPRLNSRGTILWGSFCTPSITQFQTSTGPYVIDIPRQPSQLGGLFLDRGIAYACRFIPSGVCIPYIVFHNAFTRYTTSPGNKTIIEIREEDPNTNLPVGTLKDPITGIPDNNILARVLVDFSIQSSGDQYNFAVPINAILNTFDVPHWIVIYSEDFQCANAFTGTGYRRVEFSPSTIGGNNLAKFIQSGPVCGWALDTSFPSISYVSYKTDICQGIVIVDDYGFAIDNQFVIDNCFKALLDVQNKNVIVGIKYTAPRTYRRVTFDIVYRRPNGTYFVGTKETMATQYGSNVVFFDIGELYVPGPELIYTQLSVIARVIQV